MPTAEKLQQEDDTTYTVNATDGTLIQLCLEHPGYNVSYNIAPTTTGVIIYKARGKYHVEALKFGLLPSTVGPRDPALVLKGIHAGIKHSKEVLATQSGHFNCRKETLARPSSVWNTARAHHRCVVPILGYFEWNKQRTPYYVHLNKMLYLAGLYSHNTKFNHTGLVSGPFFSSFTILTGPGRGEQSNDLSWLHSRKPIFLEPMTKAWNKWLENDGWDDALLEDCLDTDHNIAYDSLKWYTVGSFVGKLEYKGPEVIQEKKERQGDIMLFLKKSPVKRSHDGADSKAKIAKLEPESSIESTPKHSKSPMPISQLNIKTEKPRRDIMLLMQKKGDEKEEHDLPLSGQDTWLSAAETRSQDPGEKNKVLYNYQGQGSEAALSSRNSDSDDDDSS